MSPRAFLGALAAAGVLLIHPPAPLSGRAAQTQAPQTPQTFRGRTILIPVDVRVLDQQGKAVTDLREDEFAIFEDGIRQTIRHFSIQAFAAREPETDGALLSRRTTAGGQDPGAQDYRIFLIVLGRGRLQPPAKGVDGALTFVRERLLPQDRVAVLAWNRATEFTTDHEQVAQVLERFKRGHERIESQLRQRLSGLAAVYGSRDIPPSIQASIDEIFRAPGAPPMREPAPGGNRDQARQNADARRATDVLQRTEALAGRTPTGFETFDVAEAERLDVSFDEYVESSVQSMQDLETLYRGIDYLKYIDGEKHLVFVTERAILLPRAEDDRGLASAASDARVTVSTIITGGVSPAPIPGRGVGPGGGGGGFNDMWAIGTIRTVAQLTGGQASVNAYASTAFARIDDVSRFQYVLGYYPTNPSWNGRFRRIAVRVSRPGLRVSYRHGYYGEEELLPLDLRQVRTFSRISSAGRYAGDIRDLGLKLTGSVVTGASPAVDVSLTIDVTRVALTGVGAVRTGALDIAIFCGDARENVIGESWQKMDLKLLDGTYQRFLETGIPFSIRVPVRGEPRFVKVVVYDYGSDLVGAATVRLNSR